MQKRVDDPDPKQAEAEGNLIYHLANEYIDFYNQAIGIVAHHVNHLQGIIDKADDADNPLQNKDNIPAADFKNLMIAYKNLMIAKKGAEALIGPAKAELDRRKEVLEPVILNLREFQREFELQPGF